MKNHLKNQTSPYLLQHAENPVDWYPWCEDAFIRAKKEDKPIFLSIGYSTCHWCHVMAHESFEDKEIAKFLNEKFISIKVDKEERPDIDSIYMSVCQALTGSGGWPTTIFMTPDQKPFFAGTYFPKTPRFGMISFTDLLVTISEKWESDREALLQSADEIVSFVKRNRKNIINEEKGDDSTHCIDLAVKIYKKSYDKEYGGFGDAPKFPAAHNLLFLMRYYERNKDQYVMDMVEKSLVQMYRGGIFDHIGGGFSRYSTDKYFLVPHFEKMLYDNALLIMAYCKAYELTKNLLYREIAERTAIYVLNELTLPGGGFYCAQDADSEGVEGKYYLFDQTEILEVLGQDRGIAFCEYYNITRNGNFEGKNILNLLKHDKCVNEEFVSDLAKLNMYRKKRYHLHLDDKILTSWNGLMIGAMCYLYRVTGNELYLNKAMQAQDFIESKLCEDMTLYVSWREGKCSGKGFLDDYANEIFALISLYEATLELQYLKRAKSLCEKTMELFCDDKLGGFFLNSVENENLIIQPKETYDGAMPSGNSMMAYNLVRLAYYFEEEKYKIFVKKQICFMGTQAERYPVGYAMFLIALLDDAEMPEKIVVVPKEKCDIKELSTKVSLDALIQVLEEPTEDYPLKNEKTTYYVCKGSTCKPATNSLDE